MMYDWPTKERDIALARKLIAQYSEEHDTERLGLFELSTDEYERKFEFRIAPWVLGLAGRFLQLYGPERGDIITRKVLTHCLVNGESVH